MSDNNNDSKVLTPEQVAEQEELNAQTFSVSSKADWEKERPSFVPIRPSVYKLTVREANVSNEPNKFKDGQMWTFIRLTFDVDRDLTSKEIKDIDGGKHEPGTRRLFATLDPASVGYRKDGTPAKTRGCITALFGLEPSGNIPEYGVADLEGKSVRGTVEVKDKQDGSGKTNTISSFNIYESEEDDV